MTSFISKSQVNLNEYKYVVVPRLFDDFKKENQHQTSTIISFLFNSKGFKTVYDDNLPVDLTQNRCLGVYVDLINKSSMFTTKTALKLMDCSNKEILTTPEGKSREKDYKLAYKEAITEAFSTIQSIDYSYEPKPGVEQEEPLTINFENDIRKVNNEKESVTEPSAVIEQVATQEEQSYVDKTPVETEYKAAKSAVEKQMVEQVATREEQSYNSIEPVETDYIKGASVSSAKLSLGILYAQELSNGYQLVDSTPKIQLKIFKSSMPNVYIAQAEGRDGVVYTSDGKWFFEYQENGQVVKEELTIKF